MISSFQGENITGKESKRILLKTMTTLMIAASIVYLVALSTIFVGASMLIFLTPNFNLCQSIFVVFKFDELAIIVAISFPLRGIQTNEKSNSQSSQQRNSMSLETRSVH